MSIVRAVLENYCFFFFFSSRRRHTRFDCDWSSDVCSSDLRDPALGARPVQDADRRRAHGRLPLHRPLDRAALEGTVATTTRDAPLRGVLVALHFPRGHAASLAVFVGRRLLWMVPVLFFVLLVTFTLMHLAPGSPWDPDSGRPLSPAVVRNLNVKFGLDRPVWQQFVLYVWNVSHFDFGLSYQYQDQSVARLLLRSWPYTAWLGVLAFAVIVPCGIGLGVIAALRQHTWVDRAVLGFSTVFASVPSFVVGIVLIILLAVGMNNVTDGSYLLPAGRVRP